MIIVSIQLFNYHGGDSWGQELPFVPPFQHRAFHNSTAPPLQEPAETPEHLETPLYRYCHFFSFPSFRWSLKSETAAAGWGPSLWLHQRQLHRRKAPGHPPWQTLLWQSAYEPGASDTGTGCGADMSDSQTCYRRCVVTGRRFSVSSLFCLTNLGRWRFPVFDRSTGRSGTWARWWMQKSISAPHNSISWYQRLASSSQSCGAEGMYVNRLTFFFSVLKWHWKSSLCLTHSDPIYLHFFNTALKSQQQEMFRVVSWEDKRCPRIFTETNSYLSSFQRRRCSVLPICFQCYPQVTQDLCFFVEIV